MKAMIHKGAEAIANICCNRGWVQKDLQSWCIYTLEKWLGILLFISSILLWTILSGLYLETISFLIPFYFLRRRAGGCHADSSHTCFIISISLIIIVSSIVGAWLLAFPIWILVIADVIVVAIALFLPPAYPPQVHFTEMEKDANSRKKNSLLMLYFSLQLCSVFFFGNRVLAYSLCGIAFCVVTIIIQKQKRKNEE